MKNPNPRKANKKMAKSKSKKIASQWHIKAYKPFLAISSVFMFGALGAAFIFGTQASSPFVFEATNPYAITQPTEWGKKISSLHAKEGRVYSGYGDWSKNTGPITISAYNPTTKEFENPFSCGTEMVGIFEEVNGYLYAPAIDKRGVDVCIMDPSGQWRGVSGLGSAHIFDINTLNGNDVWMAGAAGRAGGVWRSNDNGQTWERILTEPRTDDTGFVRALCLVPAGDKVYVSFTEYEPDNSQRRFAKVYSGGTWSNVDGFNCTSGITENFKGVGLFSSFGLQKIDGQSVKGRDKSFSTQVQQFGYSSPRQMFVEGKYLYVLDANYRIFRTEDLNTWEQVATGPSGTRAFTVEDNKIFIAVGSDIWSYVIADSDTTAPTITSVSPAENETLSGTVILSATGSDNIGVSKMELYINNNLVSTINGSTIRYNLDTTNYPNGSLAIKYRVFDTSNIVGEKSYSATINNNDSGGGSSDPVVDTTGPEIFFYLTEGSTLNGRVKLSARANDPSGLNSIELLIDDKKVASGSKRDPNTASYTWDTRKTSNGTHRVTVKSIDKLNNTSSKTVTVNVSN